MVEAAPAPLVDVVDLKVAFRRRGSLIPAVNGVSFQLDERKTLCVLGESGSGKSAMLRALLRLNPPGKTVTSGKIRVGQHDILGLSEREMSRIRGRLVSMIFQEPMTALDPVFTVGHQIAEVVTRHEGKSRHDAMRRALDLLELVQVPSAARRLSAFPHELSGGLRQRMMIAMALACRPALLLADEPTTALDATVQIQILLLLRELQSSLGMSVIFVTHDIGVAAEMADRVAVMYAGRFVEEASAETLLRAPRHPYSRGLLASTVHGAVSGERLTTIGGAPPDLQALPIGCAFEPRCHFADAACQSAIPPIEEISAEHRVRCRRPIMQEAP